MKRFQWLIFTAGFLVVATRGPAAETNPVPNFREVYDLLRSHLSGVSDAELNRAAVEGLFNQLRGKVSLVDDEKKSAAETNAVILAKISVLEETVGYARVSRVGDGLAGEIRAAWEKLIATNKLKGLALDLRFAEGDDYAAAAAAADLFIPKERKLLDWGEGAAKSKEKTDALNVPVAVLVNRATVGAPEALAAVLRETGVGLILGNTTAGGAMTTREYRLHNGQRLRIADTPIRLGDGSDISPQGVKPDIEVAVSLAEERAYWENAYAIVSPAGENTVAGADLDATNRTRRLRPTEADLVRARREGLDLEELARSREPEKPLIRDPALARAVDLLKGLALVRRSR